MDYVLPSRARPETKYLSIATAQLIGFNRLSNSLKKLLNFVLEIAALILEIKFSTNNWYYQGIRPSTIFVESFLFYYQLSHIKILTKKTFSSKNFLSFFTLLNDSITINSQYFEKKIRKIYSAELKLKKKKKKKKLKRR